MKNTTISCRAGFLLSLFVTACTSQPQAAPQPTAQPTTQATASPVVTPSLEPIASPSAPVPSPSPLPSSSASPSPQPSASQRPSASPSPLPSSSPPAGNLQIALSGFGFFNAYAVQAELSDSQNQILSRRELRAAQSFQQLGLSTVDLSEGTAYQLRLSGLQQTACLREVSYRLKPVNANGGAGLRNLSAELNQLSFADFEAVPQSSACLATYALSGELQDAQKKPVEDAKIKATVIREGQADYYQVVSTNGSGKYLLDNLPQEGLVLLDIEKNGFAELESKYLYLNTISQQKLDLVLQAESRS